MDQEQMNAQYEEIIDSEYQSEQSRRYSQRDSLEASSMQQKSSGNANASMAKGSMKSIN